MLGNCAFWPSFHGKMSHESPWKPQLLGSCPHQLPKIYQILHTKTLAKPSLESEPCLDAPGRLFIVEVRQSCVVKPFRAWRTLDLGPVLWLQDAPGLWGKLESPKIMQETSRSPPRLKLAANRKRCVQARSASFPTERSNSGVLRF
jgi:hypothetical protein